VPQSTQIDQITAGNGMALSRQLLTSPGRHIGVREPGERRREGSIVITAAACGLNGDEHLWIGGNPRQTCLGVKKDWCASLIFAAKSLPGTEVPRRPRWVPLPLEI
jgi:hypothetical protein